MLPFVVVGLTTGSIFGLVALGLVLSYKTSGIFNFGHGALTSAAAFEFYYLSDEHNLPWPVSAAICIVVIGPVMGLLLELVARRLASVSLAMKVVATVGILLTIQGSLELWQPPGPTQQVKQFLPTAAFHVWGAPVAGYQVIIFGVGVAVVASLTVVIRYGPIGVAIRAVVDNPELVDMMGISPGRVRRIAWMASSTMAAASGVLLAPLLPLDATTLTFLVVTAFGAAAIGGFTNLPLTYAGGLVIGVGQSMLQRYFITSSGVTGGLAGSLPFLILVVLLIAGPRLPQLGEGTGPALTGGFAWSPPRWVSVPALLGLAVFLSLVPFFVGFRLSNWTTFLAYVVMFLSLGLLVKTSGQVSLCHVSFMAIGVAIFSRLAVTDHWPWLLALAGAAIVTMPFGAVLAVTAIRFSGLYLAIATLGFGILLQDMFYGQSYMFGGSVSLSVPRPAFGGFGTDRGYYFAALLVAIAATLAVVSIDRSRLGRLLRAMSDSTPGLMASGASVRVCRVLVFCISAAIAAVAGVIGGGTLGIVGAQNFQPIVSLQLFAVIAIIAAGAPWSAVLAGAGFTLLPSYISTSPTVGYVFTLLFGLGAISVAVAPARRPGAGSVEPAPAGVVPEPAASGIGRGPVAPIPADRSPAGRVSGGLAVGRLTVRFGGLAAVDGVSFSAPPGRITGVIGPNGAGKTTLFNACSGLVRPDQGSFFLNGADVRRMGVPARARHGLGRSFQHMEVFDSLDVGQNVALGCEAAFAGWNPLGHLLSTPKQAAVVRDRTEEMLSLCRLEAIADSPVGSLPPGQRRLVELARCLAGRPSILLLDEPSSGLDTIETERFGDLLLEAVRRFEVGIVLVEHDMSLVRQVCDYIYVLNFGRLIFEGGPDEVRNSPLVRGAYLGSMHGSTDLADSTADGAP